MAKKVSDVLNIKQPVKKKEISSERMGFLQNYKEKKNMITTADKPIEWIVLPEAIQQAVKLPGIPQGYTTLVRGWSDTGKSTIKYLTIAACQKQGVVPIVYETENHFDWKHAQECGVVVEPIYSEEEEVDETTGELSRKVVGYNGDLFVFTSTMLANKYGKMNYSSGKEEAKNRGVAVLEDIAYSMNEFLEDQRNGDLPYPLTFIWDSVGSIGSYKSFMSKSGNNMFDAGAISQAFNTLLNDTIPSSKDITRPYTNTFLAVVKIWNDSMNAGPVGVSIEHKGGKTMFFGARLIIHVGGKSKSAVKKLDATYKGKKTMYATVTKIGVAKNHLPNPYNTTYEGEYVIVHNGVIENSKNAIEEYKKEYLPTLLGIVNEEAFDETAVEYGVQEEFEIV